MNIHSPGVASAQAVSMVLNNWEKLIMLYRRIEFQAGEYYHIYHRGQDRQKNFLRGRKLSVFFNATQKVS